MKLNSWMRGVAALLAITFAVPCWAGEKPTPLTAPSAVTLQAATQAKLATADTSKAVRFAQAPGAGAASESKPFFKSTKGVLVGVLMVGGVAWALVSRSQDAVHSPSR